MINCYKILFLFLGLNLILSCRASLLWNIQDGIDLYNKAKYNDAKIFFINYLDNNPNDEKGYYNLAKTYLKLKDKTLALENFEKVYDIASKEKTLEKIQFKDNSQVLNDYFDMAVMYFEDANLQEAEFYADLMIKLDIKDSNAWFLKAKIANSRGQKEEAKEYLNKAILYNNKLLKTNLAKKLNIYSLPSVSKENHYLFAFENYYKGNIEGAFNNCLKYVESDKTNPEINILLAELYLNKNDTKNALEVVENGKKLSENIGYYLLEAQIYKKLEDYSKQESALLKAYKINPNNSKMLYEIGNFYLEKDNYKNAIKYFEALVNTDDSFYEGYFGYIKSLIEVGKTNSALNYIRKASAINNNQSEINYLLSLICFKQGLFDESNDYINEAILKHKNPNYYLLKAKIMYFSGNYDESLKILNETLKFGKTYNEFEVDEYHLKNYLKLKKYQNIQYYLNGRECKLDKNSLLYKYILYKIYKLEGNDKKADFLYGQIKLARANSIKEYLDLSEIIFEEEGLDNSIKLLDKAIKKMPAEPELYSQKIKIYYLAKSFEKAKEISNIMSDKFN